MRIRVDSGSDIRVALADPGFGSGKAGIKSPSAGVTPPPPSGGYTPLPTPTSIGSIQLWGSAGSYVTVAASADFLFDGDFTIEWWHKQNQSRPHPRVFQWGDYPAPLGVSLEGNFYIWTYSGQPVGGPGALNQWNHHAVCRQNGNTVTHYLNGNYQGGFPYSGQIGSSSIVLRIGNELSTSDDSAFPGFITDFHVVKGTAKYTTSFTPRSTPTPAMTGTVLLLWNETPNTVSTDGSGSGRAVTMGNNAWSADSPYA